MPLPKPKAKETEDEFMSRMMGDSMMMEEYPDMKQRAAVALSQWKGKGRKMKEMAGNAAKVFAENHPGHANQKSHGRKRYRMGVRQKIQKIPSRFERPSHISKEIWNNPSVHILFADEKDKGLLSKRVDEVNAYWKKHGLRGLGIKKASPRDFLQTDKEYEKGKIKSDKNLRAWEKKIGFQK